MCAVCTVHRLQDLKLGFHLLLAAHTFIDNDNTTSTPQEATTTLNQTIGKRGLRRAKRLTLQFPSSSPDAFMIVRESECRGSGSGSGSRNSSSTQR